MTFRKPGRQVGSGRTISKTVWISTAPAHPSNLRSLEHSFSSDETARDFAIDCRRRNDAGESLASDCFPKQIFGTSNAKDKDYKLPDIAFVGSYWFVSKNAAVVLRRFNLGGGNLYPVDVLKKDRATSVGGEWFCLNFGNAKRTFIPDQSTNVHARSAGQWVASLTLSDNELALSSDALSGPDLWIEPIVRSAIFFSEELGKALKKAKADKGFFFRKCQVVAAS